MGFAGPWWLLLLPLAAVPWLLWWSARRRGVAACPGVAAARSLAVVLAVAAIARPNVGGGQGGRTWLLLRDVSLSVGSQAQAPLELPGQIDEVRFAGRILQKGRQPDPAAPATRLTDPLALAAGRADAAAGVILVTDGRFDDDWRPAAARFARAAGGGLPFLVVPLDAPDRDARIDAFFARREAGRCALTLVLAANAILKPTVVVRRVRPDAAELYRRSIKIFPDRPATIRLSDDVPPGREGLWRASLEGEAGPGGNDAATAGVPGSERVVGWIGPPPPGSLGAATGMSIRKIAADRCPVDAADWAAYAAVVLADPSGDLLPEKSRAALERYVLAGGGLALLGSGPRDRPADRRDPLNRAAALVPNPFERNPLSLSVVLDASGSMAARPAGAGAPQKFDLAAEAVLALSGHLAASDRLSVVVFSDTARQVYAGGDEPPDFPRLAEALRAVRPVGPTDVAPALRAAIETDPAEKSAGLVLVLSDLRTKEFDPAKTAERFRSRGWDIAVVVSGDPEEGGYPLLRLARLLGGAVEYGGDLEGLDRIFARLCRAARGTGVERGDFPITAGTGWEAMEQMGAGPLSVIQTAPAEGAEVLAEAGQRPLLAVRTVGLGRSYTCAGLPPGGAVPGAMPPAPALAKMLRSAAAAGPDARFSGRLARRGGDWRLVVTAREKDRSIDGLDLTARVLFAGEAERGVREYAMQQEGPGTYAAVFPARGGNPSIGVREGDAGRIVWRRPPRWSPPRELSAFGAHDAVLDELVGMTGGRIVSPDWLRREGLPEPARGGETAVSLWPWLIAGAILLVLLQWLLHE